MDSCVQLDLWQSHISSFRDDYSPMEIDSAAVDWSAVSAALDRDEVVLVDKDTGYDIIESGTFHLSSALLVSKQEHEQLLYAREYIDKACLLSSEDRFGATLELY